VLGSVSGLTLTRTGTQSTVIWLSIGSLFFLTATEYHFLSTSE